MKLIEALDIVGRGRSAPDEPLPVLLASGFEPLHLGSFLAAHMQRRFPRRPVALRTGLYGDLAGTLDRCDDRLEGAAVVVEWSDLDPRLGFRARAGWAPAALPDIVATARRAAARLRAGIERLAATCAVAVCPPTLPLPPVAHTPGMQASEVEVELDRIVADLVAALVRHPRARVVRTRRLDMLSPPGARLDAPGELRTGFPYRLAHADAVGALLAALIADDVPKKGLITDLDDTVWHGVLGEVGVNGVSWELADGAHAHALYQQLLAALAESGTLVAAVSKNDPALVEDVLQRPDLLVTRKQIHPVLAGWGAKSEAVGRVLRAWNIAADSVVFVDDTPMELAEVQGAHPGIECMRFPKDDPAALVTLLERLRDTFGKTTVTDEDRWRLASIRDHPRADGAVDAADADAFLADAAAVVTLDARLDPEDQRALELVNKTNQFNLNGRRYTRRQWHDLLARPGAFLLRASYADRFGPLGRIAILAGRAGGGSVTVDTWVMSCRALSRRVEHQCVRHLFRRFGASRLRFAYANTGRNGPLQEFFATLLGSSPPGARITLTRSEFDAACPVLSHELREVTSDG